MAEDEKGIKPEELGLFFGDPNNVEAEEIYARYAMGDPLEVIAADWGKTPGQVLRLMKKQPERYDQTEKAREAFTGLRLRRTLSLIDDHNLRLMEDLRAGKLTADEEKEALKHLSRVAKDIFNRLQIQEGKPTDIVRADEQLTREQVLKILKEQEDAGDGLCAKY